MAENKYKAIKPYKNKDDKTLYMFKIYLGTDKKTGKRKETTRRGFTTKTAAKSAYTRLKAAALNGEINISSLKYEDVYLKWLVSYKDKVKASTFNKTKQIFKDHILPKLGHIKITAIEYEICEEAATSWFNKLKYHEKIKHYSACIFDHAIKLKLINSNPMKLVDTNRKNYAKKLQSHYSKIELIEFLEAAKEESLKKYAYLRILSYTGIRRAEGFALTWNKIDFDKKEIHIDAAVSYDENGKLIITTTKTEDQRILCIDQDTLDILNSWKKLQTEVYGDMDNDMLIFPNTNREISHPSIAWNWCDEIQKKYNLKEVSPHGLRRTHATLYHQAGVPHFEIKKRLGHSFKDITYDIYVVETDIGKIEAFNRFKAFIKY